MRKKKLLPKLLMIFLISSWSLTLPSVTAAKELRSPQLIVQNSSQSSQLNEQIIRQTLKAIEIADRNEDLEELLKFLAPFVVSEVTVESEEKSVTTNLEGIEAHREFLEKTFKLVKKSEVINQYLSIRMTPDEQLAVVTWIRVEEITTEEGKQFLSSGTDTIRFAWIDGRPMIVSLKIQGWIAERPSEL